MKKHLKNYRQKVLEFFLNDEVEKLTDELYRWHDRFYEVVPYKVAIKRHSWSSFIKRSYNGITYGLREASSKTVKEYMKSKGFVNGNLYTLKATTNIHKSLKNKK